MQTNHNAELEAAEMLANLRAYRFAKINAQDAHDKWVRLRTQHMNDHLSVLDMESNITSEQITESNYEDIIKKIEDFHLSKSLRDAAWDVYVVLRALSDEARNKCNFP